VMERIISEFIFFSNKRPSKTAPIKLIKNIPKQILPDILVYLLRLNLPPS
jgi:hypothetical protein